MTRLSVCLEKIKALEKLKDDKEEMRILLIELGKSLYSVLPDSLIGNSGHKYIKKDIFGTKKISYEGSVTELRIDKNGWIHFKYGPYKDIYDKICQFLEIVVSTLKYDLYDQTKLEKMRKVLTSLKGD
jgi:hypothetical protein